MVRRKAVDMHNYGGALTGDIFISFALFLECGRDLLAGLLS
jgi:hypothetical protein